MFTYDWIALFITFLGTMFLIGELLVNMRGLFAIIGFGFITVYFSGYLETEMFIVMMLVYFLGIILMIIDGKLLNDGTLAIIGAATMIIAVGFSAPNWVAGLYSVIGVILGGAASLLFLKVFKHRKMWSKMALNDQMSSEMGYNSMNEKYQYLLEQQGEALTDMRPVGTVKIEDEEYSAVSNGQWITRGDQIKVVKVDGTKILVKKL
ncbi:nodulation protein NfeD [Halobacillus litoralis]|uniref:Nodulation protein NfeD n=1 Tax=Halobacillus litoralis TaxID=45668 RepID=A0A845FEH6_9BACI|nr:MULTISPECIES: NfeD family protein [Halobacillus]MEC3883124.1 NfeD family protein [Halobacillus sp. HZG1]MYL71937.1 nodulation protein NfeD [Halobacillus litoralis]